MNSRDRLFAYLSVMAGGCLVGWGFTALTGISGAALLLGFFLVFFPILTNPPNYMTGACKVLAALACAALSGAFSLLIHTLIIGLWQTVATSVGFLLLVLLVTDHVLKQFPPDTH